MTAATASTAHAGTLASPLFTNPSRLKLGAFHMNCTRGGTPTLGDGSIAELGWDQQVRIAQLAEDAGLDAIIPIARWRGYGGPSRFNDEQYEAVPWAAAISAVTSRIVVFATAHVPLIHPVRVAKDVATIDHIAHGRFCLNIVAGWNEAELRMFGVGQVAHDDRYRVAAEWTTFLKRLWEEAEEFDFEGEFFQSTRAISAPKPVQQPRPPIVSAGSSPAGCDFAASHADVCFAVADSPEALRELARGIKQRAADKGREVAVWTQVGIRCGDTDADVRRQYDYFVREQGDWDAVTNQMTMLIGGGGKTLDFQLDRSMLERMIAMQHAYQLFGTPEQIVDKMGALVDAGIDGLSIIWPDYERGIETLRDQVLPVAVKAGLRAE